MASAFRLVRFGNTKNLNIFLKGGQSWLKPTTFHLNKIVAIHTSKKSKDPITLVDAISDPNNKEAPVSYRTPQNWVSFGFSRENIVDDSTYCHWFFFLFITVTFCAFTFTIMYMPDNRMIDWVKREGFIELRRREQEGLPLIDKDLVPAHSIDLPTDEELGDAEIII